MTPWEQAAQLVADLDQVLEGIDDPEARNAQWQLRSVAVSVAVGHRRAEAPGQQALDLAAGP